MNDLIAVADAVSVSTQGMEDLAPRIVTLFQEKSDGKLHQFDLLETDIVVSPEGEEIPDYEAKLYNVTGNWEKEDKNKCYEIIEGRHVLTLVETKTE